MRKQTTKQRILKALTKIQESGKDFSFSRLANRLGLTEKNLRTWVWCLEKRDDILFISPADKRGYHQVTWINN